MPQDKQTYLQNIDYITFSFYLALVAIGGIFIYSVDISQSGIPESFSEFLLHTQSGKQVLWILICLLVFSFIIFVLDDKFWQVFAFLIYGGGIAGLILVLLLGTTINGATSWFAFGGFSFQPSELAKFGTCLGVAALMSSWRIDLRNTSHIAQVTGLFMVPMALVLLQPDLGSAIVFVSFFIAMFREGLNPFIYIIGFIAAATFILSILFASIPLVTSLALLCLFIYISYENTRKARWYIGGVAYSIIVWQAFQLDYGNYALGTSLLLFLLMTYRQYAQHRAKVIPVIVIGFLATTAMSIATPFVVNNVLKPHHRQRIDVWLRPSVATKNYPGSTFNLDQSKYAISAGGLIGRGIFSGRLTEGRWVPEQDTDFIFCTIGEEQGFVGSAAVVILYMLLILRIVMIAERQQLAFNRIYAYGVAGILFTHFMVNIGMTIGLIPIIGIPLPFISKGGSSLLGFTIMIAVLLKLDKHNRRQ